MENESEQIIPHFTDGMPEIIDSPIEMNEANLPIKIYEEKFVIKIDGEEIVIQGTIQFEWYPVLGATFSGTVITNNEKATTLFDEMVEVIIDGLVFGVGGITSSVLGLKLFIEGKVYERAVLGDISVAVEKLRFYIPNLRKFEGNYVKQENGKNKSASKSRILLVNDDYSIIIDKCFNYEDLQDSLRSRGGFILQYVGELVSKKGSLGFDDSKEILSCLNTYLSFLNGRKTSTLFIHGIYEDKTIWCDYTDYYIAPYKFAFSWPESHSINGLNEIWKKFSELWIRDENKDFLMSAIHWYNEANCNSGFTHGAIIMAQTALELIYNWFIVEKKKAIIGKDSENISASSKIRLLLSFIGINYEVPSSYTYLHEYIKKNDIIDAPEAVVQIRNAIVHSQIDKRRKLSSIAQEVKYQALQLCIWYIEMSLLYILDFNEKYCNRCSETYYLSEFVPWSKLSDKNFDLVDK